VTDKLIDITKPVRTRDGREAEVFFEKEGKLYGRVRFQTIWQGSDWDLYGNFSPSFPGICLDIHNIPPEPVKITVGLTGRFEDSKEYVEYQLMDDGSIDTSVQPKWVTT